MRRILLALLMSCGLCAAADDLAQIKQSGLINVGIKDNSPPFSQIDPASKTVTGFDIDMAVAVAKLLGVKPVMKTMDSERRIEFLKNKTVDIVVADLAITNDRLKEIDFSIGYIVVEERVYGKVNRFKKLDDLKTATIGINAGTSLSKDFKREFPTAKIVLVPDKPDLAKQLNADLVDGIAASMPILMSLQSKITNRKAFEFSPFTLALHVYAVGVRKNEKRLTTAINDALLALEKSGEAAKIYERWFGPNSTTPIQRTFVISP
ncbi:transporter substrate-binding domain-containing protein [Burkholderiaceae bacterium DAT-1]|nr:transporter substrate-binding domain-containing protein [Burkholderiaceae bacterium DAT-1]